MKTDEIELGKKNGATTTRISWLREVKRYQLILTVTTRIQEASYSFLDQILSLYVSTELGLLFPVYLVI